MQVRWPVFFIVFAVVTVRVKADTRDIVGERVKPNVNDMSVVKVNGYAPLERGTGYAQILQAFLQEVVQIRLIIVSFLFFLSFYY